MRTFATVSVAGVAGFVLFKLFWTLLVPLLGLFLGLLFLTMKLALMAAAIVFVVSLLRRRKDQRPA